MNRTSTAVGAGLLLAAILIPILSFSVGAASEGWEAIVFGFFFMFIISPIVGIAGIVMLIVGLASNGGGQHQQQQVVVHVDGNGPPGVRGGSGGGGRRCAHCGHGMGAQDAFCTGCGTRVLRG